MKATYELTSDDLTALALFHNAKSPTARKQRVGCLVAGFLVMLVLPSLILATTEKPVLQTALDIWPLLLGALLFLLTALPILKWSTGKITRRMLSERQNAGYYGACSLSIEADGLREGKPSGESMRTWASVQKIIVTAKHLFVYTSAIEAFVVPRRAFATDAEFDSFVRQIAEHAGVGIEIA